MTKYPLYPQPGEEVEIINFIGKEFENDKVGKVISRDGDYILIELNKSKVVVERYPCELREITPGK